MNTNHYNLILKLTEWSVTLFTCGKKGVFPTVECMHLLPAIREAYTAHQKLMRDVDSLHGLECGFRIHRHIQQHFHSYPSPDFKNVPDRASQHYASADARYLPGN